MSPQHREELSRKAEHALELVKLSPDPDLVAHVARVLEMMEGFKRLDLEKVEPMITPLPGPTPLRPDQPGQTLARADALRDAPDTQAGFFRAPRP